MNQTRLRVKDGTLRGSKARSTTARHMITALALGVGLATAVATPIAANAAGHTCSSNNACYYNSAGFAADPPNGTGVVNPWSAVSGNYPNLNGGASPHTYNNPDVCNNVYAFYPPCNENDTISSVKNTSSTRKLRFYNNASYSGGFQTVGLLTNVSQVAYNDQISSFCWNDGSAGVSACSF